MLIHAGGSAQQGVDVHPLQGGGKESHNGGFGGATSHPVFHREALQPGFRFRCFVEHGTDACDGYGLPGKVESPTAEEVLGADHAVAGFGSAAALGDDDDERCFGRYAAQHTQHAVRVGVVQEMHLQAVGRQGVRHQFGAESGAADADDQAGGKRFAAGGRDGAGANG